MAVSSYTPPMLIAEGHLEVCFLAKRNGGLDLNRPLSSRQVKKEKLRHKGLVPVSKGSQTL